MENIQGGIIKDLLHTLERLSDKFFKYLSGGNKDFTKSKNFEVLDAKEVKKDQSYEMNLKYQGVVPFRLKTEMKDNDLADLTISLHLDNEDSRSKTIKNVPGDEVEKTIEKALMNMLTKDEKFAFGIKSAKSIQVGLQRVAGSRSDSIVMTSVMANFNVAEANMLLGEVLESTEFLDQIPFDNTVYEIVDEGSQLDVSVVDEPEDCVLENAISAMLTAAVEFAMKAQFLHWESARNGQLFNLTEQLVWGANQDVNTFGLWLVELCNAVWNPFKDLTGPTTENFDISDFHSPQIEQLGTQYIDQAIQEYIDVLDFYYPNFPHDIQSEIDSKLRYYKQIQNRELKCIF